MNFLEKGPAGPEVTQLVLPDTVRLQIAAEARQALPEECCGLLLGRIDGERAVAAVCIASPNLAPDRRSGFEIDPALLLATRRGARKRGEVVLGHYHSHPRGSTAPSEMDRARAWTPGHVWLICAPGGSECTYSAHLAVEAKGGVALRPLLIMAAS